MKHWMEGGFLHRARAGEATVLECPFESAAYCGDWCPLFWLTDEHAVVGCGGSPVYHKLSDPPPKEEAKP